MIRRVDGLVESEQQESDFSLSRVKLGILVLQDK
jgi:hypothetical protein